MLEQKMLTVHGKQLETGSGSFGELRSSAGALEDSDELHSRFESDGYLYLPGLLDRDTLNNARLTMLKALAGLDFVDLDYPIGDGVAKRELAVSARDMVELSKNNEPLRQALFAGPMITFYERFLGGPVRPLDFTWSRVKTSGRERYQTPLRCCIHGRALRACTRAGTPLGDDSPRRWAVLMILETRTDREED